MKIYDCFLFNDELDLLEIRFNELYDTVDYFVIAESRETFTGKEKPLNYLENHKRFKWKFRRKVIHIEIPLIIIPRKKHVLPEEDLAPWWRQFYQRSYMQHALMGKAAPDDIIMLSDADEIPRAKSLVQDNLPLPGEVCTLMQRNYKYFFNCRLYRDRQPYIKKGLQDYLDGTKIIRYNEIDTKNVGDFQDLRILVGKFGRKRKRKIMGAGWHFSYFGDVDRIILKMQSCSAVATVGEKHIKKYYGREVLEKRLLKGEGLFGKEENGFTIIDEPFGSHLPQYVQVNKKKFIKYVFKKR